MPRMQIGEVEGIGIQRFAESALPEGVETVVDGHLGSDEISARLVVMC
jgi:hypothetical protein